ncbi:zinc finger protein 714-like [Uranotaenia lowii]|uniref:zinc finger protein 714-like n=1 Tax=Uranotaenia lowii TaxID=190385 RepID=UPI0024789AEF|nr:zinc finger protein 714-like [Uranotaenia lowii]
MECCIPSCESESTSFVGFPRKKEFEQRWAEAIRLGTGYSFDQLSTKSEALGRLLCGDHFADPADSGYQEPSKFVNSDGQPIKLISCRFCQHIEPENNMLPLIGAESQWWLTIIRGMKIDVKAKDFARAICFECLVKLDLLRTLRKYFLVAESKFQSMTSESGKLGWQDQNNFIKLEVTLLEHNYFEEERIDEEFVTTEQEPAVEDHEEQTETLEKVVPEKEITIPRKRGRPPKNEKVEPVKPYEEDHEEQTKTIEKVVPKKENKIPRKRGRRPKTEKVRPVKRKFKPYEERIGSIRAKTCYICKPKTLQTDNEHLLAHLTQEHAAQVDYRCDECEDKTFYTVMNFNVHLSYHDPERPLKCSFCTIRYCTRSNVLQHENKEHGTNHRVVKSATKRRTKGQCEVCGQLFPSAASAMQHKLQEHDKLRVIECKICQKLFGNQGNLARHMLQHSNENPYKCEQCGMEFRIVTDMKRHVLFEHEGIEAWHCNQCDLSLPDRNAYTKHRIEVHRNRNPNPGPKNAYLFRCKLCSETPNNKFELISHIRSAHSKEEYPMLQCPKCPQKCLTSQLLASHKYHVHQGDESKRVCVVCGASFRNMQLLNRHLSVKHGAEKKYRCKVCDRRFSCPANMHRHMNIHEKVRKYECQFCDRRFSQKSGLANHTRNIHTGEKAFKCGICGEGFKESSTFYRHRVRCEEANESSK